MTDLPIGTLRVAQQFEAKGVRVVTQPNQGAAAARNTAFSLSRGDYIQWLDADDLLSPHKVTHQMEQAARGEGPTDTFFFAMGFFPISAEQSKIYSKFPLVRP